MAGSSNFAVLRATGRAWGIAAVHGEVGRLQRLYVALWDRLRPGDRVVHLGNVLGRGMEIRAALDEVLAFRCAFLARPNTFAHDFALVRGAQEEMWQKLFQLQFAVNPGEVFEWMVAQGAAATIEAYGGTVAQGRSAVRQGPMAITRWTAGLRAAFQAAPGHQAYLSALKHAAFTHEGTLLFVHHGIEPARPLEAQGDVFWWGAHGFDRIEAPYAGFRRVIRGYDPRHRGLAVGTVIAGLDAGCGFGGPLVGACFAPDGTLLDSIEA